MMTWTWMLSGEGKRASCLFLRRGPMNDRADDERAERAVAWCLDDQRCESDLLYRSSWRSDRAPLSPTHQHVQIRRRTAFLDEVEKRNVVRMLDDDFSLELCRGKDWGPDFGRELGSIVGSLCAGFRPS